MTDSLSLQRIIATSTKIFSFFSCTYASYSYTVYVILIMRYLQMIILLQLALLHWLANLSE